MAAPSRRASNTTSAARATIMDGAQRIMSEQGYAAVTFRSIAGEAGVTAGLVQYYFPTLDHLYLALLEQGTERSLDRLSKALDSEQPLRAVWEFASSPASAGLVMEFMALAKHRKAIGPAMGESGERIRQAQLEAVRGLWGRYELSEEFPPEALLFALTALPRMALLEEVFGTRTGHVEILTIIERFLDRVEPRPGSARQATAPRKRPSRTPSRRPPARSADDTHKE